MKIAVFGDIHGHWGALRDAVTGIQKDAPVDLVLQCGDAQPFRDETDLSYMHCPKKYRELGDFGTFAPGGETFPAKMLFIGGNHEPWNFLDENKEGGELAPNIEFLGRVALQEANGIRIAGLSGVYSERCFESPHLQSPYPPNQSKLVTYYNNTDIKKALAFSKVDILLLHEWPDLMNAARDESWPGHWSNVGSPHLSLVVDALQPRFVFCGHMHHASYLKHGRTEIICLADLHREPDNACVMLDTENWTYKWPLKNK